MSVRSLMFVALLSACGPAIAVTADEIIARHIEARGGSENMNELVPGDGWFATSDTMAAHSAGMVDCFRCADQYLFRIAAAQRAGAAERQIVDYATLQPAERQREAAPEAPVPVPMTTRS